MSEEEKKAIARFKANANYCITSKETTKIILDLIEKQQKEIEELKREEDISNSVMNTQSIFLESISKELGLTDEKTEGFVFTDIIKEIRKLKEENASLQKEIKLMKSININDNYISKDKIREKQIEREFELQQEYKDFEDDIQWKTYKELLEEN